MTRETKIGLLVGVAFILVIGILLSDHFRSQMEPAGAQLDGAGATVRSTVNAPGSNQPAPVIVVTPQEIRPRTAVQTPRDLEPQQPPVVIAPQPQVAAGQQGGQGDTNLTGSTAQADDAALNRAAQVQGQALVPVESALSNPTARTYTAQPGDSVSRMAARLLGANTSRNRQAIIAANASLKSDPNKVIVGHDYIIPGAGVASNSPSQTEQASAEATASAPAGGPWIYTVKSGDTLWGIATGQLGKASAVDALKELNRNVLGNGSTIHPGMKLRLPSQPVAIAD